MPYALRRSILTEIETRFPASTARRCPAVPRPRDLSITSSLHHYYALTGRAVPSVPLVHAPRRARPGDQRPAGCWPGATRRVLPQRHRVLRGGVAEPAGADRAVPGAYFPSRTLEQAVEPGTGGRPDAGPPGRGGQSRSKRILHRGAGVEEGVRSCALVLLRHLASGVLADAEDVEVAGRLQAAEHRVVVVVAGVYVAGRDRAGHRAAGEVAVVVVQRRGDGDVGVAGGRVLAVVLATSWRYFSVISSEDAVACRVRRVLDLYVERAAEASSSCSRLSLAAGRGFPRRREGWVDGRATGERRTSLSRWRGRNSSG